jgi:hypothetical protein
MIKLELTVEEVNGVLQSLGNMPYAQVVTLVEKIKEQAIPQVPVTQAPAATESDPAAE